MAQELRRKLKEIGWNPEKRLQPIPQCHGNTG